MNINEVISFINNKKNIRKFDNIIKKTSNSEIILNIESIATSNIATS